MGTTMAIIGWLTLCVILALGTAAWAGLAFNGLGRYNIGGVPNSPVAKVGILLLGGVVVYAWYSLFLAAPFSIVPK